MGFHQQKIQISKYYAIFEIQNDGNGSAEIVWEWHLWDHLIQDYCISCPNYGVVSEHPELFNIKFHLYFNK